MEMLLRDLRYALRLLGQRPLFALIAGASIAVGIGATTVLMSVMDTLLLRPPRGVATPERVVEVGRSTGGRGFDTFSFPELVDIREQARTLEHVAGWRITQLSFSAGRESERIQAMAVSAEYFTALGLRPRIGRLFRVDEDRVPGAHALAVLDYRFWHDRFHADRNIIGRTIDINRRQFTVVGVLPAEFRGHLTALRPDLYFPLSMFSVASPRFDDWNERGASWVTALARLRPGATLDRANAELAAVFARLPQRDSVAASQRSATVGLLGPIPVPGRAVVGAFLSMLFALAGLLLLITCANVAGMLIARATARHREIAIRLAMGAGRGAIVRQLALEALLIFSIGGLGGVLVARWGALALSRIDLPIPIPLELDFHAGLRVLLAGLALALITGLVFGLAPALQASNTSVMTVLKADSARAGSRGSGLRRSFVIGQITLSFVLLACAGLFLRSLQRATRTDAGFDPNGVQLVGLDLDMDGYNEARSHELHRALLQRIGSLPGVTEVGFVSDLPLDFGTHETMVVPDGWTNTNGQNLLESAINTVGGDYFGALRIPLLQGRTFDSSDTPESVRAVLISRAFAERVWPGQNPLGRQIRYLGDTSRPLAVIGVVGDVKNQTLMETIQPAIYVPTTQNYESALTLVVRSGGRLTAGALRAAILEVDPRFSMSLIQPLERYTNLGTLPQRVAALITTSLGLLALVLSALGVYGVIAFMVAQRTREIGTRMALGASRGQVLRLILRDGVRLAAPGFALGLAIALAIGYVVRTFILGVAPTDPLTFMSVSLALLAAVALACWIPALRASGVQPSHALKTE